MDPATMMMLASVASSLISGFGGKDAKEGSTYNKGQRGSLDDLINSIKQMRGGATDITQNQNYQQGQDWLQSMFNDPEFFNKFEAPLQRQFQEETVPGLANRFASMGSGGSLGSTGFRNQLGREGSNLSTNIASLRGGMQQQAIPQSLGYAQQPFSNLMNLYQQALQPTNNTYQPASAGPFAPAATAFTGAFSQGYGNQLGQRMAGQSPSTY